MKTTIESVVKFAANHLVDAHRSNIDETISRIILHLSYNDIIKAYNVSMDYTSSPDLQFQMARLIITDLLNKYLNK